MPCRRHCRAASVRDRVLRAQDKHVKAVCVVHNETATGITSDVGKVRKTMDDAGCKGLLMVDGVSSIGALPFKMDEWQARRFRAPA
jgi:alanine-glyoxylate transaminase / serine-glyoxylate transaminase / serine-pyruvate transaminase